MAEQENKLFGTAMFGGFKKQDVLSYVEYISTEYSQAAKKYQSEIEQLRNQKNELKTKFEAAGNELADLNAQLTRKNAEDNQYSEKIDGLMSENAGLRESIQALTTEGDALKAEVARMKANEASIETIKLHLADIEISAYQRADLIDKEIERKREKGFLEISSLISDLKAEFESMKSGLEDSSSDFVDKLEKMQETFRTLPSLFVFTSEKFDAMFDKAGVIKDEEPSAGKVLMPLPLEEDAFFADAGEDLLQKGDSPLYEGGNPLPGEESPSAQTGGCSSDELSYLKGGPEQDAAFSEK